MWIALLLVLTALYSLWFAYLGVMALKRADDAGQLSWGLTAFAFPGVALAVILDWLVNWLILTALLLELPRELLVTQRLSRHLHGHGMTTGSPRLSRWRKALAKLVCEQLLDRFDPSGKHCKCKGSEPAE
jgi:hypothetical protein